MTRSGQEGPQARRPAATTRTLTSTPGAKAGREPVWEGAAARLHARPQPLPQPPGPHYQVFLDGQDAAPGSLAVGPLARDDDGL